MPVGVSSYHHRNGSTVIERLVRRSIRSHECLEWNGSRGPEGYGYIKVGRRSIATHRAAYEMAYGPIPKGKFVCHSCDNPACIEPAHLFLGTPADNNADMVKKKRHAHGDKHRSRCTDSWRGRAKLSPEQIRAILADTRPHHVIAADFGVSRSYISMIKARTRGAIPTEIDMAYVSDIRKRKNWKHIP